jgi:CheY-like chemotaxis protein
MTILIVDDNAGIRKLLRRALGKVGTRIYECVDGSEAVQMYAECQPDIVLMDIKMQHLDGLAATRLLREAYPSARVVIVTDYDDDELRIAARAAGACAYVIKQDLTGLESIVIRSVAS